MRPPVQLVVTRPAYCADAQCHSLPNCDKIEQCDADLYFSEIFPSWVSSYSYKSEEDIGQLSALPPPNPF